MLRCAQRRFLRAKLGNARRLQHTGPHQEYFQNPGQFPTHLAPHIVPPSPTQIFQRSVLRRALRSTLWAMLSSGAGYAAGVTVVTWDYLISPFEPGSDLELELFDAILEQTNEHPLVLRLKEDPEWQEQKVYSELQEQDELGLFNAALMGSRGIVLREFIHEPSFALCFVVFVGDGVEGWPDTAHGGIISCLLQEAVERNANNYTSEDGKSVEVADIEVSFHKKVQPSSIYSIHVHPGFFGDETRQVGPLEGQDAANEELDSKGLRKVSTLVLTAEPLDTDMPTVGTLPFQNMVSRDALFASAKCTLNSPIHVHMVP